MSSKSVAAFAPPAQMSLPVPPPQSPIPPGDRPPLQTKEEQEAWAKYYAELEKSLASLFNLLDLQKIVGEAGAPALLDTPHAQTIVRFVAGAIANRCAKPTPLVEKTQKQIKQRKKEWAAIRRYVENLANSQNWHRQWFVERPWYGPDAITFREDYAGRLDSFTKAMDELGPWLFVSPKTRGQHGGIGITNPADAVHIFVNLNWAWEEAGVTSHITKSKRYKIVFGCLKAAGEKMNFTEDALGRAIAKHLRAYPYHAEKPEGNSS